MKDNNVILISDERQKAEAVISKILLLRSVDSVGIVNFEAARELLTAKTPDLIMIHVKEYEDTSIISTLRNAERFKNTPILMLCENTDSDILCKAYDSGIDDFADINSEETVLVMRVMWAFKKRLLLTSKEKQSEILSLADVTDKSTGFYTKVYTQKIFAEEFSGSKKEQTQSVFVITAPDTKYKSTMTVNGLAGIIKRTLRASDAVGFAPEGKFYIILYQTEETGARRIFERINAAIKDKGTISASAMKITTGSFAEAERLMNRQLAQALEEGNTLYFVEDDLYSKNPAIPDKSGMKETNLKLLKRIFLNKTEKLLTPIFFKMQAIYEPKFFNTEIKQTLNDEEGVFLIKGETDFSKITIKYGDYTKLTVEIINSFDYTSGSEKFIFEPQELTSERLESIIQTEAEKYRKQQITKKED